jgi:hypothetical protein
MEDQRRLAAGLSSRGLQSLPEFLVDGCAQMLKIPVA